MINELLKNENKYFFEKSLQEMEVVLCHALGLKCSRAEVCAEPARYRYMFPIDIKEEIDRLQYRIVTAVLECEEMPFRVMIGECEDRFCYVDIFPECVMRMSLQISPERVYEIIYEYTMCELDAFYYTEDMDVFRFDFDIECLQLLDKHRDSIVCALGNICPDTLSVTTGTLQGKGGEVAVVLVRHTNPE